MKRLIHIAILIVITAGHVLAQEVEQYCPMHATEQQQMKAKAMTTFAGDGLELTANGELRVLIVFVRFPDDSEDLGNWWLEDDDPNILNSIIDVNTSVGSTHKHNLTHYFKTMSRSDYDVVGDAISIEAPQTAAGYSYDLGDASKDVLDYISDNNLATFANYDNWTANGSADNDETADDLVDMVLMVWKSDNFVPGEEWGGCAAMYHTLGCGGSYSNDPGTLAVNGGKDIEFGFGAGNGSGVTAFAYSDVRTAFNIMTHEIAHWLLGSGHPYGGVQDNRVASLLGTAFNRNLSVNASERERLGWDVVPEITTDLTNRELRDYLTTGDAYKFKVPNGGTNEYYYIENHQKESIYDDATMDDTDNGIFVLHTSNATINTSHIRYLNSDGDWDWANVSPFSISGPCCGTVPLFGKIEADPDNGENYMTEMYADNYDSEWHWPHGYKDEDGNEDIGGYYRGDEDFSLKGSYNTEYGTLFSSHTNPKTKSWSGNENSFALKVIDEDQGVITVDLFKNYDPHTITENTTWDGQIFLDQYTKVENNATLTILPGTTVYLEEDVNLSIRSGHGGKLLAEGTEEEPIRFLRADPNEAWGTVYLSSSEENSIKWALFDGGSTNLTIASKNNTVEHSTFRNATFRNIDTWHNNDGGNSSATLSHVLIENAATVGIVAQYTDLDISNTTIQNNNQAGIYITSASVYPFHHNEVVSNGGSTRDGVEVMSTGTLDMRESVLGYGYNEISDNGDDQISTSGDLIIAPPPYYGSKYNSIHGDYLSSGNYLVDNNSGTTVDAFHTWWGDTPTVSAMFDGSVEDYGALSSDPTTGENPGAGGLVPSNAMPEDSDANMSLEERYTWLESELQEAETTQQIRDGLHRLYRLSGLAKEEAPELTNRFRQLAGQVVDREETLYVSSAQNTTIRNTALVLQAKSFMRSGEYGKAETWLTGQNGQDLTSYDRRDWLHLEMELQRYNGRYEDALATLESLYAFQESREVDLEEVKNSYKPIEEDIKIRLEAGEGQTRDPQTAEEIASSDEVTLGNHPNPFNPTTVIDYQLPENSDVRLEVYDMLGRRVAVLVDEAQPAGRHQARFDGNNLASGVYFYRLKAASMVKTRQMTLVK